MKVYQEYTVVVPWYDGETFRDGVAEVMVHVSPPETGKIVRAYGYCADQRDMPARWLGQPTRNRLFRNFTQAFMREAAEYESRDFNELLSDAIAEEAKEAVWEAAWAQRDSAATSVSEHRASGHSPARGTNGS